MSIQRLLHRNLTQDEIRAYQEDGAAVIRQVIDNSWIELMRNAIERILQNPGEASIEYTPNGKEGRYYGDFFIWRRDSDFESFMKDSPLPQLASQLMGSSHVNFFYDQLLVKEPKTHEPTPLHQDLPYWPLQGNDISSVWVPFDKADQSSGVVHYVKGSHKWGKRYAPRTFSTSTDSSFQSVYDKMNFESVTTVEDKLDQYDILHWEMEPGDVLVHHPLTLHFAPGNASSTGRRRGLALRYTGTDARWDARPGTFMENPKVAAILPEITLGDGDHLSGELFPQVWPR